MRTHEIPTLTAQAKDGTRMSADRIPALVKKTGK